VTIRRLLRPGPILLVLLLLAFLATGISYVLSTRNQQVLLQREIASAQKEGIPLEPYQLIRHVAVQDNAAPDYLEADRVYKLWKVKYKPAKKRMGVDDFKPQFRYSHEQLQQFAKEFASLQPVFAVLDRIALKSDCNFDRHWDEGPKLLFPEYEDMRSYVRYECNAACVDAELGNIDSAFKRLQVAQRITEHTGKDPVIIAWLVEVAAEAIVLRSVENIISRVPLSTAVLDRAEALVRSIPSPPALNYYLAGEMISQRITVRMLPSMSEQEMQGMLGTSTPAAFLLRNRALGPTLERYSIHSIREFWKDMPTSMADFSSSKRKVFAFQSALASDTSLSGMLANMLTPVLSQFVDTLGQVEARRRAALVGITILRSHLAGNPFPSALPNCGVNGMDPMYDEPLHYVKVSNGFIVYNRSPDGIDNGSNPTLIRLRFKYEP